MFNEKTIGSYFVDADGQLWQHIIYAAQPTATLKKVSTGEHRGGVIGSPILSGYREATHGELIARIEQLENALRLRETFKGVPPVWPERVGQKLTPWNETYFRFPLEVTCRTRHAR